MFLMGIFFIPWTAHHRDLLMRGTITGHADLLTTYNFVLQAAHLQPQEFYEELVSFFAEMKILVLAFTSTSDGFNKITREIRRLNSSIPYEPDPPGDPDDPENVR